MGIPEYQARRFEGRIRDASILLSKHCDNSDWVRRAKDVLRQTGRQNIGTAGEKAEKPMQRLRSVASGVSVSGP